MYLLAALLTFWGFSQPGVQVRAASAPEDRTLDVLDVQLHYLDWGGTGDVLLFLPPTCETPHIFGDVAPAFVDNFHVLGLTTRGCGQSGEADDYGLDAQLAEVEAFLDTLRVETVTLVGFSASGGKVIRFSRLYPDRVQRLVVFDSVYSFVAPGLEERMGTAITQLLGGPSDAPDWSRRNHEAWELGAWSAAMDRNASVTARASVPAEWWDTFREDVETGRYFETQVAHPALMFFAVDLDQQRLKQFDADTQADIRPLAEETDRRRRAQVDEFRSNGSHVRVVEMTETAHYCFVHRPDEVIRDMRSFLTR